jgi:hypothetical protein
MSLSILQELRALGVDVVRDGDDLVIRPASRAPQELKQRLRDSKAQVLAALAVCPHCGGKSACSCAACTLRRTAEAVPCLQCRPAERQLWLGATRREFCFHCGGTRVCGCISCVGVCVVCGDSERARECHKQ